MSPHHHHHNDCCNETDSNSCHCHAHEHSAAPIEGAPEVHCACCDGASEEGNRINKILLSLLLLCVGVGIHYFCSTLSGRWVESCSPVPLRLLYYLLAFLPVGGPVLLKAWHEMREGDVFNEFFLMAIAALGAFAIGEYPEAVAVMVFYALGEYYQDKAVDRANDDIRALVDLRPDTARVLREGEWRKVSPDEVTVGEEIEVLAGERVPLDGALLSAAADFDTAALTGESMPRHIEEGKEVSAGMIVEGRSVRLRVVRLAKESALSRILKAVKNAYERKSRSEKFIRRFARIYTPIVTVLALALAMVPPLVIEGASWTNYIYRACVFLVVSCPCALVISIPLGYYSGIGVASSKGILFKGSNYLDRLTKIKTIVFDKTGTLTEGLFKVYRVITEEGWSEDEVLKYAASLEQYSNHPIARAIVGAANMNLEGVENATEVAGKGMVGMIKGKKVVLGNQRWMEELHIGAEEEKEAGHTYVFVAVDGNYAGTLVLADETKKDAAKAVKRLRKLGIKEIVLCSGDRTPIVATVAKKLGIDYYAGDLLPENKLAEIERLQKGRYGSVAFVGDGINDAPALAMADVSVAMGGSGSDVAVETADVVLQTEEPIRVADALEIALLTRKVVLLNIFLALSIKGGILLLGALGYANLWLAVLADTGVALWCVLNTFLIKAKS